MPAEVTCSLLPCHLNATDIFVRVSTGLSFPAARRLERRLGEPLVGPRQVALLAVGAWHVRRLNSGSPPLAGA